MNIDRISHYLFHEFLHVFVRVLFFFIILLCCVEWFRQMRFISAHYQGLDVLWYVLLMIPRNLAKTGPLLAVTMSLAVGWRLSQTSELIAIRALGFPLKSLLGVVTTIAFLCASMLFISSEWVAPKATAAARELRAEQLGRHYAMLKGRDLWLKLDDAFVHVLVRGIKQPVKIYQVDKRWRITKMVRADDIQSLGEGRWQLEKVRTTYFDDNSVRVKHEPSKIWQADLNPEVLDLLKLDLRFTHIKQLWRYLRKIPHLWRTWDYQMAHYFLGYRLIQPLLFIGLVLFVFLMLLLPTSSRERLWLFVSPLAMGTFFYLCFELSLPMMKVFQLSPWVVLSMPLAVLSLAILFVAYKVRGGAYA